MRYTYHQFKKIFRCRRTCTGLFNEIFLMLEKPGAHIAEEVWLSEAGKTACIVYDDMIMMLTLLEGSTHVWRKIQRDD